MRLLAACLLAGASSALAEPIQLGAAKVEAETIVKFEAPLSPAARAMSKIGGNPELTLARCAIIVPTGFDPRRPWPIFIENAPMGFSAVDGLAAFGHAANDAGWVALAAEASIKPKLETTEWSFAALTAALDALEKSWPGVKRWPMAAGGFSGGGKRAAYIGAMLTEQRHTLIGLWMGGCNEDRASDALKWHKPGPAFLRVPIYLSSGTLDPIATPAHHQHVRDLLAASRFTNVRLETYAGTHWMDENQIRAGLDWFRKAATAVPLGHGPR